jgi:hypothetical protein
MGDAERKIVLEELKRQQLFYVDAIIRIVEALKRQPHFDIPKFEADIKHLKQGLDSDDNVAVLMLEVAAGERHGPT